MIQQLASPMAAVYYAFTAVVTRGLNNPALPLTNSNILKYIYGEGYGNGCAAVNVNSALSVPALWRGVNLLANDVAKLPCFVYKRMEPAGKSKDAMHPAYKLIRYRANRFQKAGEFRRTLMAHALLARGGFAFIDRNGSGDAVEMLMLDPYSTYPFIESSARGQRLFYATTIGGSQRVLDAIDVLHIKGLSWDGLTGLSILDLCREAIGLPIARQRSQCKFYTNGMRSSGMLMFPGHIDEEAQKELLTDFEAKTSGLDNTARTILLEDGVKYQQLSITPEDAQLVENAQFSDRQIALLLGVPVHKLGDTETTSFASLEQQNQSYLDESLDPWLVNWEDEFREKLLREREKENDTHVVEFVRQALLRANTAERTSYYSTARQWGWLSVDDIRDLENMNPLPDSLGQDYLQPMNMQVVGQPPPAPAKAPAAPAQLPPPEPKAAPPKRESDLFGIAEALYGDCKQRMLKRLALAATKAARRPGAFGGWLDAGIIEDHGDVLRGVLSRPVELLAGLGGDDTIEAAVAELFGEFRAALAPIADDHTPLSLPAQVREAVAQFLPEEAA
ncbi:MAG TPA: phage portal protein [Phycisphaerae bacterium]|nr:phage portal protein [Phycisphaerae bacterium]